MFCPKCGEEYHGHPARCPSCDAPLKKRKPPVLLRLPMMLLSIVLCLALIVGLLAAVLLTDIRVLTSTGGIQTILSHLLTSGQSDPDPTAPDTDPGMASGGVTLLSSTTEPTPSEGYTVDANGNIIAPDGTIIGNINDGQLSGNVEDPSTLSAYLHDIAQQILGEDVDISLDQVQTFVEESTVMDFLSEKFSSYIDDAVNGTHNTTITAEEIKQLIDDNEVLLEETFQIEITEEDKAEIYTQIDQAITETDLNNTIRSSIDDIMQEPVPGLDGMTISDLLAKLQALSQTNVLILVYGLCLLMILLICLLNYYNVARGMRWAASSCMLAGSFVSGPLAIIQFAPSLLTNYLPEAAELMQIFSGAAAALAPVHYGVLILGVLLMVVSFLWRFFNK